jgi:hypothetical protein
LRFLRYSRSPDTGTGSTRLWRTWMFAVYPNVHVVTGTDQLITKGACRCVPGGVDVDVDADPTHHVTGKRLCSAELDIPRRIGALCSDPKQAM